MPTTTDTTTGLRIAQLSISYDRGTTRNQAADLGLDYRPSETTDGQSIRGLGSHWRSAEAKELVQERVNEEGRIRDAFKRAFLSAPIRGFFLIARPGDGERFLSGLDPQPRADVQVSISEYVLGVVTQAPAEIAEWSERVSKQLQKVPLGRGQSANGKALEIIEALANCPVISEQTRGDLAALIKDAKLGSVSRVDFRRKLAAVKVGVTTAEAAAPRRVRVSSAAAVAVETTPAETAFWQGSTASASTADSPPTIAPTPPTPIRPRRPRRRPQPSTK